MARDGHDTTERVNIVNRGLYFFLSESFMHTM